MAKKTIGIRNLKNQASQVLRAVRDEMSEYIITYHGEPVAILRPLNEADIHQLNAEKIRDSLAEMKSLSREVSQSWKSPKSGVELISEQRR